MKGTVASAKKSAATHNWKIVYWKFMGGSTVRENEIAITIHEKLQKQQKNNGNELMTTTTEETLLWTVSLNEWNVWMDNWNE